MIGRNVWRRSVLIVGLLTAAAVFYAVSQMEEPARQGMGSLVFSDQFMPGEEAIQEVLSASATGSDDTEKAGDVPALAAMAPSASGVVGPGPAFDTYRLSREQNRSRRLEILERFLEDDRLSAKERSEIQNELAELVRLAEIEAAVEGLLLARGVSDALVALSASGAEVIVTGPIEADEVARIGDLVARLTGVPLDAITIADGIALN